MNEKRFFKLEPNTGCLGDCLLSTNNLGGFNVELTRRRLFCGDPVELYFGDPITAAQLYTDSMGARHLEIHESDANGDNYSLWQLRQ